MPSSSRRRCARAACSRPRSMSEVTRRHSNVSSRWRAVSRERALRHVDTGLRRAVNSTMPTPTDVVIVGGGIAGSSLAYALANEGLGVTILEATTEFPDRVRGASMQCWGVAEARVLGVESVLLDAGAHISATWNQYTEGSQEPAQIPMSLLVPGVGGTLNLRHPDACQALIDAAAGAGATVVRGAAHI